MKAVTRRIEDAYYFEAFHLDALKRVLLREGETIPLTSKRFDLLLLLVRNHHRVVDKDELLREVWPDTVVEESNLAHNISALRKALGERPEEHRFIVTIPGQGYRFVAAVSDAASNGAEEIVYERTRSRLVIEEETGTGEAVAPAFESELKTLPTNGHRTTAVSALPADARAVAALAVSQSVPARWTETRVRVGALALVAVCLLVYWLRPAPGGGLIRSIAVLPFKPLVADSRDEALELGISESLITRLSNLKEIVVRPMSNVRKYAELEQDPVAAGKEQHVEAVLDGNIQKTGERVRVTVRLVKVSNGQTLWADKFDARLSDIFALEDSISERAVAATTVKLTGKERQLLTRHYTDNPEAYQLCLKGRLLRWQWTEDAMQKAIECFDRAIAIDPNYALAYCGKADLYSAYSSVLLSPAEAMPKAREAARKALALEDQLAEAHHSMAKVKMFADWDWAGAEREFKRALEIKPNDVEIRLSFSALLTAQKRFAEALVEMKRAQELDPLSLMVSYRGGVLLYLSRRNEQAIEQYREAVALYPNYAEPHAGLGCALRQKGMYEEALAELEKAVGLKHREGMLSELGHTYALVGRRAEALKLVKELEELAKQRYVSPVSLARIYAGLGESERVFAWLNKGYEDRSDHLLRLGVDPSFDGVRSDPRFADLLRRVGLPQ